MDVKRALGFICKSQHTLFCNIFTQLCYYFVFRSKRQDFVSQWNDWGSPEGHLRTSCSAGKHPDTERTLRRAARPLLREKTERPAGLRQSWFIMSVCIIHIQSDLIWGYMNIHIRSTGRKSSGQTSVSVFTIRVHGVSRDPVIIPLNTKPVTRGPELTSDRVRDAPASPGSETVKRQSSTRSFNPKNEFAESFRCRRKVIDINQWSATVCSEKKHSFLAINHNR